MLHIISTVVIVILITGLFLRKRRDIHPKLMFTAFVIDLVTVLYIEFTAGAVERVASELGALLIFHAAVSLTVLVLYVWMIVLGRRLLAGREDARSLHFKLAIAFCVLRSVNYVTSYLV